MRLTKVATLTFGIWIISIPQVLGQPSQRIAPKKQTTSGQLAQNPSNGEQSTNAAELKAIADAITKYEQETAKSQNQETPFEKESIKIQRFLLWVGIAQTLALIGTLLAVWNQSKETSGSTKAMEKSVKLQEVAMRPWVIFDNWESHPSNFFPKDTEGTVTVCFDLYNPTKLKLTLKRVSMKALEQGRDFTLSQVLAPEDDPYTVEFTLALRGERLQRFRKDDLVVVITGYVEFEDVFGDRQPPQSFGYMFICGQNSGLRDVRIFEGPPNPEAPNAQQNPN
jgi:hypothetical protein